jgi:hypothetical protein
VDLLHAQCPNAQVLVLDIPPRGLPINPLRGVVLQVNQALSQRAWGDHARFVRVADRFVLPDGRIDQAAQQAQTETGQPVDPMEIIRLLETLDRH